GNFLDKMPREGLAIIERTDISNSQKSQENSQKRASTDTRIGRVQKEAKESKPKPEKPSLSQNLPKSV
ncbi:hypothetical protein Tco_0334374, partial [Tanacetum coccineum]